jgi:hypothetical protein
MPGIAAQQSLHSKLSTDLAGWQPLFSIHEQYSSTPLRHDATTSLYLLL